MTNYHSTAACKGSEGRSAKFKPFRRRKQVQKGFTKAVTYELGLAGPGLAQSLPRSSVTGLEGTQGPQGTGDRGSGERGELRVRTRVRFMFLNHHPGAGGGQSRGQDWTLEARSRKTKFTVR